MANTKTEDRVDQLEEMLRANPGGVRMSEIMEDQGVSYMRCAGVKRVLIQRLAGTSETVVTDSPGYRGEYVIRLVDSANDIKKTVNRLTGAASKLSEQVSWQLSSGELMSDADTRALAHMSIQIESVVKTLENMLP